MFYNIDDKEMNKGTQSFDLRVFTVSKAANMDIAQTISFTDNIIR